MNDWTPEMVEERLIEAASVLRRLPAERGQGYFSTWPRMAVEFSDLVGQTPEPMRLPPPSAAAISRMEQTLGWAAWLEPIDAKIAWLRASGTRWKEICWEVGLARAAAHEVLGGRVFADSFVEILIILRPYLCGGIVIEKGQKGVAASPRDLRDRVQERAGEDDRAARRRLETARAIFGE